MNARVIGSGALAVATVFAPLVASAQTLLNTLGFISTVLNDVVWLLITIAIIVFFWGLIQYLLSINEAEKRNEGLKIMTYGIIALFVMVSIWGIIRLLQATFKVTSTTPVVPQGIQLNTSGSY